MTMPQLRTDRAQHLAVHTPHRMKLHILLLQFLMQFLLPLQYKTPSPPASYPAS